MVFLYKHKLLFLLMFLIVVPLLLFALPGDELSVSVIDGGKSIAFKSSPTDVAELLQKNGFSFQPEDRVLPDLQEKVTDGMIIRIIRAREISLEIDGETRIIKSTAALVEEVLAQGNVILGPDDKVAPELNELCADNIKVVRVEKKTVAEEKSIAYTIEKVSSEQVYAGVERIREKGVKGLEKYIYEVVLEDGQEVSRRLLEKILVKQPVKQVVDVGSLKVVSRGGESIKFSKAMTMTATGYTHTGNMTYTDIWPTVGVVAVDPKVIPLRTRLFVEGYGYATAMDTGGAIKGARIDLFFETRSEAMKWGRRKVEVYVLE